MSHKGVDGQQARLRAPAPKKQERRLQEVWAGNLEEEIFRMRDVAENYQHVAMDTLLPGIVARPTGPFGDYTDYNYQTLRCNVDLTRALQISMTLSDDQGVRPKGTSTWRFNFAFDTGSDLLGQEGAEGLGGHARLGGTGGPDLSRHRSHGIDEHCFGELLMSSGLVLNDEVKWVSFCGTSRLSDRPPEGRGLGRGCAPEPPWVTFCGIYNFAYLLQLLTSQVLPEELPGFWESLDLFFPCRCNVADHVAQLPPGPPLSSRDPADPQRRPLFCSGQHVLEAFFRLPDAVRRTAFDSAREELLEDGAADDRRDRRRDDAEPSGMVKSGNSHGAGNDVSVGVAAAAAVRPLNGAAKTGGG